MNQPGSMYSSLLTMMLASRTHVDELPPGLLHPLPVEKEDRKTHVEHGGAHTSSPPTRVFRTLSHMTRGVRIDKLVECSGGSNHPPHHIVDKVHPSVW